MGDIQIIDSTDGDGIYIIVMTFKHPVTGHEMRSVWSGDMFIDTSNDDGSDESKMAVIAFYYQYIAAYNDYMDICKHFSWAMRVDN